MRVLPFVVSKLLLAAAAWAQVPAGKALDATARPQFILKMISGGGLRFPIVTEAAHEPSERYGQPDDLAQTPLGWRSLEAVAYVTLEWVDWLKNRRLLEQIGNIPPAEAEVNFYASLETEPMAA